MVFGLIAGNHQVDSSLQHLWHAIGSWTGILLAVAIVALSIKYLLKRSPIESVKEKITE